MRVSTDARDWAMCACRDWHASGSINTSCWCPCFISCAGFTSRALWNTCVSHQLTSAHPHKTKRLWSCLVQIRAQPLLQINSAMHQAKQSRLLCNEKPRLDTRQPSAFSLRDASAN